MSDKTGKTDKTDKTDKDHGVGASGDDAAHRPSRSLNVARTRGTVARVVWGLCLAIALILAAAAFGIALDANPDNALVRTINDLADVFDLGLFDLQNPVWAPSPSDANAEVKTALANYGAAAVAYLVVGRVLERLIRP